MRALERLLNSPDLTPKEEKRYRRKVRKAEKQGKLDTRETMQHQIYKSISRFNRPIKESIRRQNEEARLYPNCENIFFDLRELSLMTEAQKDEVLALIEEANVYQKGQFKTLQKTAFKQLRILEEKAVSQEFKDY